jgi:two-component system, cell cycle response regulator DivK
VARSRPRDSRPVVLLVQQDRDDREMYAEFLRYRRFRPVIASTVAEAIEHARTADIIVTGITLPSDADGLEFIAELRRDPHTRTTPIIVLTATMLSLDRQRAIEAVCDGLLRKPCLPGALVREMRRVLGLARMKAAKPPASEITAPKAAARKPRAGSRRSR